MDRVPSKITVGGRPSFQYRSLSPGGDRACFTFRSSHVFHLYFFFLATVILIHCFFWLFTTSLCLSGCLPNITRNAIVNCSELVTYDIIKELILKHNLMSGMCKHFTFSHWNFRHLITALFFPYWTFSPDFVDLDKQMCFPQTTCRVTSQQPSLQVSAPPL